MNSEKRVKEWEGKGEVRLSGRKRNKGKIKINNVKKYNKRDIKVW